MGLLSALLPKQKEIQECLRQFEALESEFNKSPQAFFATDHVVHEAKRILLERQADTVQFLKSGRGDARTAALLIFRRTAGELVSSGHFHIYRGMLSQIGQGLLAIFDYAESEMVKSGYTEAATSEQNRARVRKHIQEVG
jgi:regulator of sigma D